MLCQSERSFWTERSIGAAAGFGSAALAATWGAAASTGGAGWALWTREAWTWHVQTNYAEKVLLIERLRLTERVGEIAYAGGASVGDIEDRLGYYIVGRIGRAAGRWTWGQYSPLIPQADFDALFAKARADGTILHSL